ncbi:MAG: hypothetical protein R3E84_09270 [Pseudomonadales bacterium]
MNRDYRAAGHSAAFFAQLVLGASALVCCGTAGAEDKHSEEMGRVDTAHLAVSNQVDTFARWLDAFFNDDNYVEEEADSRLDLRQIVTWNDLGGTAYRSRVSGRIALPNLSRKLSLTFEGNQEESVFEDNSERRLNDATDASLDSPAVGLRYILKAGKRYHTVMHAGVRLNNPSFFLGPRFRYSQELNDVWLGRYSQRIFWDVDDGWESQSRVDFDRLFSNGHLLRHTAKVDWREDKKHDRGIRYTLSSTFVQRLDDEDALSYGISSQFSTKPKSSWKAHSLSVRYRRNFFRDWAFIEGGPFVAFEDNHNWKVNPGVQIVLDIIFQDGMSIANREAGE